ncbi:hypothetical protein ACFFX0_02370 [Citricoccus parietis]|uniref:Uncharacterized protein n=1 Tax=Citricoccus parietis TaxID=592307 RepID=A0ABV5FTT2_9MICC
MQDHPVHESRHGRLSSELLGTTRAVVTSLAQIAALRGGAQGALTTAAEAGRSGPPPPER